jgi:hypothetical protein
MRVYLKVCMVVYAIKKKKLINKAIDFRHKQNNNNKRNMRAYLLLSYVLYNHFIYTYTHT